MKGFPFSSVIPFGILEQCASPRGASESAVIHNPTAVRAWYDSAVFVCGDHVKEILQLPWSRSGSNAAGHSRKEFAVSDALCFPGRLASSILILCDDEMQRQCWNFILDLSQISTDRSRC